MLFFIIFNMIFLPLTENNVRTAKPTFHGN